jgi:ABC-2 type transport system ATP-binding protein
VQLAGPVDDLADNHRLLVGPRHDGGPITGVAAVIKASHTDRQSTLLVRTDGPLADPMWTTRDVTLEDVILGYLAEGETQTSHAEWGVPA